MTASARAPTAAAERVLLWLEDYILSRDLKPGAALPKEIEIARACKTSRSSVREAVTALKALGLLRSRRRGGLKLIREPLLLELRHYLGERFASQDRAADATEFRAILERGLAELIFDHITPRQVATLRTIAQRVQDGPETDDLVEIEEQFHRLMAFAAGNRLAALLSCLYVPVFRSLQAQHEVPYRRQRWLEDHWKFVEALEAKDKPRFIALIEKHTQPYLRGGRPAQTHNSRLSR